MSMLSDSRGPYTGPDGKVVLAFDVGTSFSCISYSILEPGVVPTIFHVTRFAHQPPHRRGKVASLLRYDDNGRVCALGSRKRERETSTPWFKLLLSSNTAPSTPSGIAPKIPPPTPGKTPVQVFSDFLSYLYDSAHTFIKATGYSRPTPTARGLKESEWSAFEQAGQIHFVLTHPNGWADTEKKKMGKAALLAGLVSSEEEIQGRISFVSEGEASLYHCLKNGASPDVFKDGNGVVVVDAGGATIDFSAYALAESGEWFDEIAQPVCQFQGSIFVSLNARAFLEAHLARSQYVGHAQSTSRVFDETTKLTFEKEDNEQSVRFLGSKEVPKLGIGKRKLTLKGSEVASFFEPSISCIVDTVKAQIATIQKPRKSIFLVGGFSRNEYLYTQLVERLEPLGFSIFRPLDPDRSVADGALSLYLDYPAGIPMTRQVYNLHPPYTDTSNLAAKDSDWISLSDIRRFLASFVSDISHVLRDWIFLLLLYVLLSL